MFAILKTKHKQDKAERPFNISCAFSDIYAALNFLKLKFYKLLNDHPFLKQKGDTPNGGRGRVNHIG